MAQWKAIPGIGGKRAARLKATKVLQSSNDVSMALDMELPDWLQQSFSFEN
jgi:hypothetical protein